MLVLRKYSTGSGSACIGYTCVCVESGVARETGIPALLREEGRGEKMKGYRESSVSYSNYSSKGLFDF